jgi:2-oxoglutarate dehydrogenase E1 component
VQSIIEGYPAVSDVVWVQEEPENMGAWDSVRPHLDALVAGRARLALLARPRAASPAEGSAARHARNQQLLIERALGVAAAAGSKSLASGPRQPASGARPPAAET